jgi:hypothetical protein
MKTRLIIITLANLLISSMIFAQAPDKFNYQAVLRDASGNVRANANANVRIDILQGSATGTNVFAEAFTAQTNAFGLISLEIGNGTLVSGNFSTIDWAAGPYFIKISVDGTEFGTSQLLSVPYAKYAEKAGNVFSGSYTDLTNKPSLAAVAASGSYNDLTNKPTLFDGTFTGLTGKPTTIAGYGINDAVTTSGTQTVAGVKTFSSTVKVDSLYLTKKTTKWVFHANNLRVQETASGGKIVVNPIGESYSQVVANAIGASYVFMPLDVPFQILGNEQKVKSITFNYKCASTSVYITNTYVRKHKQGDMLGVITSSTNYTSTTEASVTLTAPSAVAFADNELDILFSLQFDATGTGNAINFYEIILILQ